MIDAALDAALASPWALVVMTVMVFGDAFFVIVPGEVAVTALGAAAVANGSPPLWAVVVLAAIAAASGDLLCYAIGRRVGTERWRWMRSPRVQKALSWARQRLDSGAAVVLFTARFVPFARLAINLTAGATRIAIGRYTALVVLASTGWALYQAAVGALIATIVPGGPVVAILVSIITAVAIGVLADLVIKRVSSRRSLAE